MRLLNKLLELHKNTKTELQKTGRRELSRRLYRRDYEMVRIGRGYDDRDRDDVQSEVILQAYLARKVYVNEKYLRGRFFWEGDYENECKFTAGLWEIFSTEVFNEPMQELDVPTTYNELETLFANKNLYTHFSLYNVAKCAVLHSILVDSPYCRSTADFDLWCCLPGGVGWTIPQHNASLHDGRKMAPQRLIQCSMGMYKYDHVQAPEPHVNYWKKNAELALTNAIVLWENQYILRFRNASMIDIKPIPDVFLPVKDYKWNIKRA